MERFQICPFKGILPRSYLGGKLSIAAPTVSDNHRVGLGAPAEISSAFPALPEMCGGGCAASL